MLRNSTEYPTPIIDTSTRRTHKHCRRLGYLTNPHPFGQGWRMHYSSPPLLFGTHIHDALDYGYSQTPTDYKDMVVRFTTKVVESIKSIVDQYRPGPRAQQKYDELVELGQSMLTEYADWAPDLDDFDVVETESSAYVPIRNPEQPDDEIAGLYYVRFDGLVKDDRGRLWVMEHKTCNKWWTNEMLMLDEQITAYTWAAQKVYNQPVAGVLLNFLRKVPITSPPLLQNGRPTTSLARLGHTTAARYDEAVGAHATVSESIVLHTLQEREEEEGHPTLRREKITRSPYAIAEQERRIYTELVEMQNTTSYPPSPNFMCHSCPMNLVCQQMEDGEDWKTTLKLCYKQQSPIWEDGWEIDERDE